MCLCLSTFRLAKLVQAFVTGATTIGRSVQFFDVQFNEVMQTFLVFALGLKVLYEIIWHSSLESIFAALGGAIIHLCAIVHDIIQTKLIPSSRAQNVRLVHYFLSASADLCEPVNMDLQNDDVEEVETAWGSTMRLELIRLLFFAFIF